MNASWNATCRFLSSQWDSRILTISGFTRLLCNDSWSNTGISSLITEPSSFEAPPSPLSPSGIGPAGAAAPAAVASADASCFFDSTYTLSSPSSPLETVICASGGNKTDDGVRFLRNGILPIADIRLALRLVFFSPEATLIIEFRFVAGRCFWWWCGCGCGCFAGL